VKSIPNEPYVTIYQQDQNCAVLYSPTTKRYRSGPLHLNQNRPGWRVDVYERIQPAIERVRTENKGPGKESQNFTFYRVLDWVLLAAGLGLASVAAGSDLANDVTTILSDESTSPTEKESLINARVGQGAFRSGVLELWDDRCSVTGSSTLEAIRASHIKPWRESTDEERLDPSNGLPLVASLDALFDAGLISFESSGSLIVSPKLKTSEQQIFGLSERSLTKRPPENTAEYLAYHRNHFFRK
jgi:hypothetical protein